jgi:hypothetical protein
MHLKQGAVAQTGCAADRQRLDQDDRIQPLRPDLGAKPVLSIALHPKYVDHALGTHRLHRWGDSGGPFRGKGLRLGRK